MNVAETILNRLGRPNQIAIMIGASFAKGEHKGNQALFINFKAKASKNIKNVVISYDEGMDLYNVEFRKNPPSYRASLATLEKHYVKLEANPDYLTVENLRGVYCEDLTRLFEETTGLYLSL